VICGWYRAWKTGRVNDSEKFSESLLETLGYTNYTMVKLIILTLLWENICKLFMYPKLWKKYVNTKDKNGNNIVRNWLLLNIK